MGIGVWQALTFPLRRFTHFCRALADYLGPQLLALLMLSLCAATALLCKGWLLLAAAASIPACLLGLRASIRWFAYWIQCIRHSAAGGTSLPSPREFRWSDGLSAVFLGSLYLLPAAVAGLVGHHLTGRALGAAVATNSDKLAPLWVLLGSSTVVSTLAVAFLAGVLGATLISLSGLRLATSNRLLSALNLFGMWRDLRKGGPDFFLYQAFLMAPGGLLTLGGILIGSANVFLIPLVWLLVLPVVCYTHLVQASLLGQYHRIYLRNDRPARSLLPRGCLIPLVLLGLLGTAAAFLLSCLLACFMCWVKPDLLPSTRPPKLVRYAPAPAPDSGQYAAIDAYALKATPSDERDLDSLAAYLGRGAKSEREKARAIFRWIADRVAYDVAGLKADRHPPNDPEYALRTRLVVCDGYSKLYQALAERMGLEVEYIYGAAKSGDDKDPFEGPGHAWNRVKIDGRWCLLDSTWGAGHVDSDTDTYQPGLEDFYFLTPPEQFIYSHFPDEEHWQGLSRPWIKEQFRQSAELRGTFFRYGLQLKQSLRFDHGIGKMVFEGPEGLAVLAQVGENRQDRSTLVSRHGRLYTVEVSPTRTGHQKLTIFVGQQQDESLAGALRCRFDADQAQPALPDASSTFVEQEVELMAPRLGELHSDQVNHFELRIPGADQVFVSNADERLALRRVDFDHFVGDLSLRAGEATVFVHYGSGGYQFKGILDYQVR